VRHLHFSLRTWKQSLLSSFSPVRHLDFNLRTRAKNPCFPLSSKCAIFISVSVLEHTIPAFLFQQCAPSSFQSPY
jgi:hypothetical protein